MPYIPPLILVHDGASKLERLMIGLEYFNQLKISIELSFLYFGKAKSLKKINDKIIHVEHLIKAERAKTK